MTPYSVNSPLWGESPSKEGGEGGRVRGSKFEALGTSNPELRTLDRAHIEVILVVFFDLV